MGSAVPTWILPWIEEREMYYQGHESGKQM
jgi:hypothetical protein